jgi:AraC-like DNA-binding protein
VPWALPPGQGQSLLICLKGEAFFSSPQGSFAFGARAHAMVVSAHTGTLLMGASGLVVKVSLPRGVDLEDVPPSARFEHLRRMLAHLASIYLEDGDPSVPPTLADAYGALLIEAVRADIAKAREADAPQDETINKLSLAKDYIAAHLFERIRLSDVAQALGVSPRIVQLIFAQEAGETLTQYVTRLRLDEAHQRLLRGDVVTNVTQIAMDCGFNHAGMFSAVYRRAFGELPRDTLARARREPQGEVLQDDLVLAS